MPIGTNGYNLYGWDVLKPEMLTSALEAVKFIAHVTGFVLFAFGVFMLIVMANPMIAIGCFLGVIAANQL